MSADNPTGGSTYEESLHLRLSELEVQYSRQKRTTMLMAIGLVGAVAISVAGFGTARAVAGSERIVAKAFELRNEDGVPHGTWKIQDNGSAVLTLNDRNGIDRVRLSVLESGAPGLALADAKGRARVVVSLLPDLTGTLAFADEDGNTRAVLGLGPDGSATLVFADPAGETRIGLGVGPDGRPSFTMLDEDTGGTAPDTGSNPR